MCIRDSAHGIPILRIKDANCIIGARLFKENDITPIGKTKSPVTITKSGVVAVISFSTAFRAFKSFDKEKAFRLNEYQLTVRL